jgi:hypothetical protein
MGNDTIEQAFKEGLQLQSMLGEGAKKTIERFTYKFLEALRRQDYGDISHQIIRFYQNFEKKLIPDFFINVLKDNSSLSQIGYAFLLGLNSNKSSSQTKNDQNDQSEEVENIENTEQ